MKCVKNSAVVLIDNVPMHEVRRMTDDEAEELVREGRWNYASKGCWKSAGRPQEPYVGYVEVL